MAKFLSLRRGYYARRAEQPVLQEWLSTRLPGKNSLLQDVPFLVVDLEMTGLDTRQHNIVSIGWLAIDHGSISLNSSRHLIVRTDSDVGQSATIHQIRDVDLESGVSEQEAMQLLLHASRGRVLVFHNATLDCQFLDNLWRKLFGIPFLAPAVDTLMLEKQLFERTHKPLEQGDLRLDSCRKRYNLPQYAAHNALVDALATAELFLAIAAKKGKCQLKQLLSMV